MVKRAPANDHFWSRVTTSSPGRRRRSPHTAATYRTAMVVIRAQTSTWACQRGNGTAAAASIAPVVTSSLTGYTGPDVERGEHRGEAKDSQADAGDEQASKEPAVEAEVHEEGGDDGELHHRHGDQHRRPDALRRVP